MRILFYSIAVFLLIPVLSLIETAAQSGGGFEITQTVIANGGGTSRDAGNNFSIEGTNGQHSAGTFPGGGPFSARIGFWTPVGLIPTAANVTVSGQVLTADGRGVRGVYVTLSGGSSTAPRTVITGSFGKFYFREIEVGQIYVISISSKRYEFPQSSQVISVQDNVSGILFQAAGTE